ncbi:Serine/arginine repetitive matrix protein 2 [Taenia crassiceps]|uniref:Serine/arginine repetitive matrix protein 2 n=1 Tax=Taenia crassiceps TaxID=6207 RepID=A0ABR4QMZ8_9CEST
MYNGIGLPTPRGSGTNGYVQRNLAYLTTYKDKINYKTDTDVKHADALAFKEPNKEILMHEKKRQVEGYTEEEIDEKVSALREELTSRLTDDIAPKSLGEAFKSGATIIPDANRLIPRGTHETAAVSILKNTVFKEALGIAENYEDGSAMQSSRERRQQAEAARALFESQKSLKTLKSSSEESEEDNEESKEERKARRHKKTHSHHKKHKRSKRESVTSSDSGSVAENKEKRKKRRKHRHHRDDKA